MGFDIPNELPADQADYEQWEWEQHFEHYWSLLGKQSSDTFNECKLVPNEECFKGMLRAAYSMGWAESRQAQRTQ